ncbi:FG-GAP repeat protein, putative [Talaromyces stipitatus ATCC 10500]|uniref:FG-GAP repeat protein, putative n=1 Tax=Talaromyces stipitatus (strain ATCC 10500 / CBS 375.48 / QM 6759 / NRRL 1006) TaxID=441959 RepID=B8MEI1_TALSN|nr:FG-GAP repeat protein, putative [Talaromyces stipitatus ATCC 10500]EED16608.1 FG-GAP repeat protein, putative [Talaromyces stipitatus ATCC 10500]
MLDSTNDLSSHYNRHVSSRAASSAVPAGMAYSICVSFALPSSSPGTCGYEADMAYIQTNNPSVNNVQIEIASSGSYYDSLAYNKYTVFSPGINGVWQLADYDNDGSPDLIYIQNRNTASGKVELKIASGASNYQTLILQTQTVYDAQINGRWQMIDYDGDGKLDLVYIQNSNTPSNKVEVKVASGASSYKTLTKEVTTVFSIGNDGTWQIVNYDNDGNNDLAYIQNINTSSGYVEVTILSGASNYQTTVQSIPTTFSVEDNGTWQMIDWDGDGYLDLVYIKEQYTAGTVEIHVASGFDESLYY